MSHHDASRRAHASSGRLKGQSLLQLPHAAYDLWPHESDPKSYGGQPECGGDPQDRPAECVQPMPPRQDSFVDWRASDAVVQTEAGRAYAGRTKYLRIG